MRTTTSKDQPEVKNRPALSPEAKQSQLVALAVDIAEEQMRNRTASSQIITHFLKLGTTQAQVELERLKLENKLIEAKTESLQSAKKMEEMYANAIAAMQVYSGNLQPGDNDDTDVF